MGAAGGDCGPAKGSQGRLGSNVAVIVWVLLEVAVSEAVSEAVGERVAVRTAVTEGVAVGAQLASSRLMVISSHRVEISLEFLRPLVMDDIYPIVPWQDYSIKKGIIFYTHFVQVW
jgi:hypothetical protein